MVSGIEPASQAGQNPAFFPAARFRPVRLRSVGVQLFTRLLI
jgi:hypothetical protein